VNINASGDVVIGGDVVGGNKIVNNIHNFFASLDDALEHRRQRVLLQKVKAYWIDGVLQHSLPGAALIELGKEALPGAVQRPFALAAEPTQTAQPLPAHQAPFAIFEGQGRSLLILGAAGSGKTFTLLELARDAIVQAEHDPAQPIPVVFPLASWARRRAPLAEWLADELSSQYQIPKQVGARWIKGHLLLPLLDGLDEIPDEAQAACVAAINTFHTEHGLSGLVVTCRSDDYASLPARLKLNGAIALQPLGAEQVEAWLRRGGHRLEGLRAALAHDAALRELATTPLMLNVMSLAFADQPASAVEQAKSEAGPRHRLFGLYVQRMLRRPAQRADPHLAGWLHRLARAMLEQRLSILLIEQLQPNWLPPGAARWAYVVGLWLVLGVLIAGALGLLLVNRSTDAQLVRMALGAASGLLGASAAAILNLLLMRRAERQPVSAPSPTALAALLAVVFGTVIFLAHWIGEALVAWALGWPGEWWSSILVGAVRGSIGGLIFGLLLHWLAGRRWADSIQPVEALGWKWGTAFRGALSGGRSGAVLGLVLTLFFDILIIAVTVPQPDIQALLTTPPPGLNSQVVWLMLIVASLVVVCGSGVALVLVVGGIGAVIGGLIGGLRGREVTQRVRPNQGIRQSVRNALLAGALFGGIGSVLFTLAFVGFIAAVDPASWLEPDSLFDYGMIALTSGWAFGLIGALRYGGLAVIQHFALRAVLATDGQLPLCIIPVLDEACDRTLLQKVGGGFIFIHRALLEYFAQSPGLGSQPS